MSIHSRWRRHRHAMSSLAVAALLTGPFGLTAIFATTQVASAAATGDFTLPVGASATISGAAWSACDPLTYGYVLSGTRYPTGGTEYPIASKPGPNDCVGQTTPAAISGTTTIGPVTSQTTLTIYLTDDETSTTVPTAPTFTSDGNHALVSGTNPYTVDIADDAVGSCGLSCSRVPAQGNGNVTLTLTITPPPITGSSVTVGPATTNVPLPLTTPVATFVDPDTAATFNATISWGDSTAPSAGTITLSGSTSTGSTYTVAGTHTYTAHGTTASPVTVTITASDGGSAMVTDNDVTVADAVITCTTSPCSGTLTSSTLTAQASTSSTGPGDLFFDSDPSSSLNCGDNFRHAPTVIDETNTFGTGAGSITTTDTFLNKNGIPGKGLEGLLYAICFESNNPFVDASGKSVTLGLLQICNPFKPGPGPCVNWILPGAGGTIVEKVTYPAGDPKYG